MKFSRRDVIKGMGAAGLTPLLASGCGDDTGFIGGNGGNGGLGGMGGGPPLPDLPEYEFDGTPGPETLFEHGVASGDPLADGIILWTRVSPDVDEAIEVWWEMSLDSDFTERVAQGTVMTDATADYTAKIDVRDLVWGRNYYYRFFAQGRQSPIGRTRLAPSGAVDRLRFGVCSCSNYGFGWFHSYRHMAERADLDAVLHLGDYFYEYENGVFPVSDRQLRMLEPPTETITLDDYRTRFSLYRRDPDLQELHRQMPFITVWDDHETANNSWMNGAENHTPPGGCEGVPPEEMCMPEGEWADRLAAGRQAYFEWLPIRENDDRRLYRTVRYGDLADLIMLDTRIEGREEQSGAALYALDDPNLPDQLLGSEQEAWLFDELQNSNAQWKVIGNQVVMGIWQFSQDLVANQDQWTGYPGSRNRLMAFLRDNAISNVVVVTGDVHSSWAMEVTIGDGTYDPITQTGAVGVEFVSPGITSPFELGGVAEAIARNSPHIQYFDSDLSNGYFVLDLQADKAQADWFFAEGLEQNQSEVSFGAAWATMDGESRVLEMGGPEVDDQTAPPLAPA